MMRRVEVLVFALALALIGCGGGGGSGGGGAGSGGVMWPDRGGGSSGMLPPSVVTGRVVFESASGEACCVAVDPMLLSPNNPGAALLVLDDLPAGPATVTIAGFPTDFAPAVEGITLTCKTIPASAGTPCDPTQVAVPSFESSPLPVSIVAGARVDLGEVDINALPFVLPDFTPAQGAAVSGVGFQYTVVDAVTGIRADSVTLDVSFDRAEGEPPVFRKITKRVPLDLDECADGSDEPCSPGDDDLDLVGFKASAQFELPEGEVSAHLSGQNLAPTPRSFDLRYSFFVLPTAIPTPTIPPPAAPDTDATADAGGDAGSGREHGPAPPTATPTATPEPDEPAE